MQRTLITGGAGFVGSHLCERFLSMGHHVVCLDNFITSSRDNVAHLLENPKFKMVVHDISTPYFSQDLIDNVLHFASPASPIDYLEHPIPTMKVGALGTHNSLGLAKKHKARYLLASTSEVYGDPLVHPQVETYWGNVNPIGMRGVYDEAKRFAESLTMAYHREHKVNTHIIRIFNTYGERMQLNDGRVVPNFIYQAFRGEPMTVYGDGSQTRSFQYVSDLVEGIVRLLEKDYHDPVNLGNPAEITIKEFAEEIRALAGSKSEIVYRDLPKDDPKQRKPNISRAKEVLGWEPVVDRKEGLKRTMEFFKDKMKRTGKL
ncbi:MAG: UDP-glucuronic acid decarboxylase family protein [Gemmataceae bacterium]